MLLILALGLIIYTYHIAGFFGRVHIFIMSQKNITIQIMYCLVNSLDQNQSDQEL